MNANALVLANPSAATSWLVNHPNPSDAQALVVFQTCPEAEAVFATCGCTMRQKLALIRQGINSIAKLRLLGKTREKVFEVLKPTTTLPVNRGGCEFGIDVTTALTAATLFFEDRRRRNQLRVAADLTDDVLDEWIDHVIDDKDGDDSEDELVKGPGKLTVDDFLTWKESLELKLRSMKGTSAIPLFYVIRGDPPATFVSEEERLIYEARQAGNDWRKDNKRVAQYLLSLVTPTDGHEWVRNVDKTDGKAIFKALTDHYEGAGFAHRTIEKAQATIANLVYKNEQALSWESFSTRIKHAYDLLERHGCGYPLHEQLRTIRRKIQTTKAEFNMLAKSALTPAHMGVAAAPGAPHQQLAFYLSAVATHVSTEFPTTLTSSAGRPYGGRYRTSEVGTNAGRDRDYHIENVNGRQMCNGVDVTDRYRGYNHQEWAALPAALQKEIFQGKKEGRGGSRRSRRSDRRQQDSDAQTRIAALEATIAQIQTGASQAPDDISAVTTPTAAQNTQTNANVSDAARSARSLGPPHGALSRVTEDGTGTNKKRKAGVEVVRFSNVRKSVVTRETVTPSIASVASERQDLTSGWLDEDSHADMNVAGRNCVMLSTSGYVADVIPFYEGYDPTPNVEIVQAATAYVDPLSGTTIYLVMPSSLWFGDRMSHSLFNGLLARDAGTSLSTDPHADTLFGIDLQTYSGAHQLHVPFKRRGNIIGVRTFRPSRDEVLMAMSEGRSNVVYLGPENHYDGQPYDTQPELSDLRVGEITPDDDVLDPRPLIVDLPFDADETYGNAIAPHNEAPLLWQHQLYQIMSSKVIVKDVLPALTPESESEPSSVGSVKAAGRHHGIVTPELLQRQWGIGFETARNTIRVTTQLALRHATHPLRRRYRTDLMSLNLRRFNETVHSDILHSRFESLAQNKCGQLFTTKSGLAVFYPFSSAASSGDALTTFTQDVGIPNSLHTDNAKEMTEPGTEFQKTVKFYKIKHTTIEPHTPKQNRYAEGTVGLLRRMWKHHRSEKKIPARLWDYFFKWACEIISRTYRADTGRTGLEAVTGDTPDISEWTDFTFYAPVWYWDSPDPEEPARLGRWLGVAHRVGAGLCYWVLTKKGTVMSRTSVQNVTNLESQIDANRTALQQLDEAIGQIADDGGHLNHPVPDMLYLEDIDDGLQEPFHERPGYLPEVDDVQNEDGYDEYIGAELILDLGGEKDLHGTVIKRAKGEDGSPLGKRHNNPLFDTRRYQIQLADGSFQELSANLIAQNLYTQVNEHGHRQQHFKEIDGHRFNGDTSVALYTGGSNTHRPKTTKGWEIRVRWRDGSHSWLPMNEVRQCNPIELAEYAVLAKLNDYDAFAWWVPHALRCRRRMVSKVKSKYWRTTHKFGIRLPKNVAEAYQIDKVTGTDFWHKAIEKEMKRIREAMLLYDGDLTSAKKDLIGYQKIDCHMVFDIKMEGLVRKARFVAGGHTTETPKSITYSSVVTRESVRIGFLVAAMNDLEIYAADIGNAYLNADCREKIYFVAGPEFGTHEGKVLIIKKALYGLKSSGAAWRAMFAQTLTDLKFKPSDADPDVWIRPAVKPDGYEYYEMLLVYVDDILHITHHSLDDNPTMTAIGEAYRLKEPAKPPTMYLGANVGCVVDETGTKMWYLSASDYINGAIQTVEANLPADRKLRGRTERPFDKSYRPELDATPFLDKDRLHEYQGYIGILRWIVELGRVDIMVEISQLASFLVAPREGHYHAVLNIFAYLRKHPDQAMFFNPHRYDVDETVFQPIEAWRDLYGDIAEEIPPNLPTARGAAITLIAFVDADHAGDKVTRRSQSGFVIYGNSAPLIWFSKKQSTLEASTFGAEMVAMRVCTEAITALRHKLRTFGIPVLESTSVFCDNGSVVNSTSDPTGRLGKKHLAICWHKIRECCAQGVIRIAKIAGEDNTADLFTKILDTPRRTLLIQRLLRYFRVKPAPPPTAAQA